MRTFSLCVDWVNGRATETFSTNEKCVRLAVDLALSENISREDYYVVFNGRRVAEDDELVENGLYHAVPRILGGKGGFGSMLRALGAQIEKTTNREACRDLSGRRMRDVNNEKKLRDWAAKSADRDKEKQERRREKRERMLAPKKLKEEDKDYEMQRQKISDDLDDAFKQGMKKRAASSSSSAASSSAACCSSSLGSSSVSHKRKSPPTATEVNPKRAKPLIDLGDDGASSSDESVNEDSNTTDAITEVNPGSSDDSNTPVPRESEQNEATNSDEDAQKQNGTAEAKTEATTVPDPVQIGETLDLEAYSSAEELCNLGLEVLKAALTARGLKCGGTLKERADRLYSVKGLNPDQIPASLLAKPAKKK